MSTRSQLTKDLNGKSALHVTSNTIETPTPTDIVDENSIMFLFYSLVISSGFLSLLVFITIASNQNTANFQKVICILHEKSFVTNLSCTTKPINRYKTMVGGGAFFSRPANDIMIHIKLYQKLNVVYKPFLVDVKENLCDAVDKRAGSPYIKIFLNMLGSHTSLNHSCPYKGWLEMQNLVLDLSKLNVFMPKGEYRVDIMASYEKSSIKALTIQAYVEIGEKNNVRGK